MTNYSLELNYQRSTQSVFEHVLDLDHPVLLLSNKDDLSYQQNRWDIAAANPVAILQETYTEAGQSESRRRLCNEINTALTQHCTAVDNDSYPFISGAIGLISYAAGEHFIGMVPQEPDARKPSVEPKWPQALR